MTTIRLKLTAFFVFYSAFLFAQDLTGLWQGVSYQKGTTSYYILTLNLQQTGINVTGIGLTKLVTDGTYGIQSVKGTVNGNVLTFADQAVIDSMSTWRWCMRYGDLTYDPALEKLYGDDIQTTNCQPFIIKMELYRLKIFADTTICNVKNVTIRASGQNLRWYKDSTKRTIINVGESINPFITQDTTFYVTQSLYDVESPVVPVTIRLKSYTKNQSIKLCEGKSIAVADTVYKTSGVYTKKLTAITGCDSLIITKLTVNSAPKIQRNLSICTGQTITIGDTVYKTSGIYNKIFKTTEGCDSTITTNLTVNNVKIFNQTRTLCEGEKLIVGDTIYQTTGNYTKRLTTLSGCDSLVTTNLTVKSVQKTVRTLTICPSETVTVGDTTYKTSGIYNKILKTTAGCDSTVMTNLTVSNIKSFNQTLSICEGEKVVVGDTTYKTSGVFTKKYKTGNGCDSVVITNLTVNPIKKTNQDLRICNGKSLRIGDTIYRTEGTYFNTLRTYTGCDSLITTNLKVLNEITFSQKLKICEGLSVSVGDTTYKTSGIYVKKLRSTEGCDSVVTTDLSVIKLDLQVSQDTLINLGDSVKLTASINLPLAVTWKWTPNIFIKCDTCAVTWMKPNNSIQYQVEVSEKEGKCRKTGSVFIKTKSDCALFVPTAFSPNGDNMNDIWTIYPSNCIKTIKRVAIFNRWGNQILSKNDIPVSPYQGVEIWDGLIDGKEIEIDIFVYVIEAEYTNGEKGILGGNFTLTK